MLRRPDERSAAWLDRLTQSTADGADDRVDQCRRRRLRAALIAYHQPDELAVMRARRVLGLGVPTMPCPYLSDVSCACSVPRGR